MILFAYDFDSVVDGAQTPLTTLNLSTSSVKMTEGSSQTITATSDANSLTTKMASDNAEVSTSKDS